ncbi:MAG: 2,3-bisphosphoglycerate-independent phosphoglycerate mutase [Paracoccaceae bacterium]|jgi:2,3-bisphosphoglycerate-independent phosphoglycerate mutase
MTPPKPVILCILDGWGLSAERENNAVALSNTPTYDHLLATCPNATLKTSGLDVGLPAGQMGNSEVGHTSIGAGRVVMMDLGRINASIANGEFAQNPALLEFIQKLKATGGTAHLLGLISDGGVHSHIDHMVVAAKTIAKAGVKVKIHALTDGRDVAPGSSAADLQFLEREIPNDATIATVSGRFFAMDRDNRWARIKRAYQAIVHADGHKFANPADALLGANNRGESDEFIGPSVIGAFDGIKHGDGTLCLNFRTDRAREILSAIGDNEFTAFDTPNRPKLAAMAGMTSYSLRHSTFMDALFERKKIVNTLGHWVSEKGKSQFRLAETEKYAHVTFFMNGGRERPEVGEERMMPKSPRVKTYDLQPEMSSIEVTENLIGAIEKGYDLIIVNYANPDMVGHTGDLKAAIAACEAVDLGLEQVVKAVDQADGAMIVTADHGNCETMVDPDTSMPHTAHTTNPVPVILVGGPKVSGLASGGRLADLAPSLLDLMGLEPPPEMTGKSLIIK